MIGTRYGKSASTPYKPSKSMQKLSLHCRLLPLFSNRLPIDKNTWGIMFLKMTVAVSDKMFFFPNYLSESREQGNRALAIVL